MSSPIIRLHSAVAKLEGKKVEVGVEQVREVVARLMDVIAHEATMPKPTTIQLGEMGLAFMEGIHERVAQHQRELAKGGGVQ